MSKVSVLSVHEENPGPLTLRIHLKLGNFMRSKSVEICFLKMSCWTSNKCYSVSTWSFHHLFIVDLSIARVKLYLKQQCVIMDFRPVVGSVKHIQLIADLYLQRLLRFRGPEVRHFLLDMDRLTVQKYRRVVQSSWLSWPTMAELDQIAHVTVLVTRFTCYHFEKVLMVRIIQNMSASISSEPTSPNQELQGTFFFPKNLCGGKFYGNDSGKFILPSGYWWNKKWRESSLQKRYLHRWQMSG